MRGIISQNHMAKYIVLYRVPVATMEKWKGETKPEEMKAQGEKLGKDMMAWMQKHEGSFADRGIPLGKTKTVTVEDVKDARNDLNYMQIVEAASHEEAAKLFIDNPHLQIPTSYIDVMEVPHMGL